MTDRTWTVKVNDDGRTATARFGDEVKTVPIETDENGKRYVTVAFDAGTFSTREQPMNIHDFITQQINEDERLAQAANDDPYGDDCWFDTGNEHIGDHHQRHGPDRVLRDVASARGVLARHTNDPTSKHYPLACIGCPTDEIYGDHEVEDIADCPELQDLAWRWHTAEGWDPKWCPHYETHLVKETPDPQRGPFSLKFCTHCGDIRGRVYEIDVLRRAALEALGLDPNRGILRLLLGAEQIDLELTGGLDVTVEVADLTPEQRAAIEAYALHPGAAR
jgi:hypothetical protein